MNAGTALFHVLVRYRDFMPPTLEAFIADEMVRDRNESLVRVYPHPISFVVGGG